MTTSNACKIKTCDRPIKARGWCSLHYDRWRKYSDPTIEVQQGAQKGRVVSKDTGRKISHIKTGMKYTRRKLEPWKPSTFGETHWNWKGGITSADKVERQKFRTQISPKVLARDNYICQICFAAGVYLHADHIKSWSEYPEFRFDIDNCRTLCRPCHYYITFKRKMPLNSKWGTMNVGEL